uniref:Uncharacterized protein n=1 Tax=Timema poppense TaxID=170557 RepID=A0A7R9GS84_TIMPO|nr:unnamed protein product [Timema poppensis]
MSRLTQPASRACFTSPTSLVSEVSAAHSCLAPYISYEMSLMLTQQPAERSSVYMCPWNNREIRSREYRKCTTLELKESEKKSEYTASLPPDCPPSPSPPAPTSPTLTEGMKKRNELYLFQPQASVKMRGRIVVILCVVMSGALSSSGLPHTTRGGPRNQVEKESSERKLELHSRVRHQTNESKLGLQPGVQSLTYDSKLELHSRVRRQTNDSKLGLQPGVQSLTYDSKLGFQPRVQRQTSNSRLGVFQALGQLLFGTVKDLRQAYFQISEIVSRIIIPPSSRQPSSTTPPNVTNGTTTEAPFVITQEEVLDIIRRNLGGLVRLFRKEYRLALNDSYKNAQQWNKELRESLRNNLT